MSDTPFWKQDTSESESDTAPQTPADTAPVEPGEVLTVGGRQFVHVEGVSADVEFADPNGRPLGMIRVPYDPDNQPREEEVLAEAERLYQDLEHMRSIVRDDLVISLAQSFVESGVAETIIKAATDALRGSFRIHMTDEERASKTPEELAEWELIAREAERLYDAKVLERGIRAAVDARDKEGDSVGAFWLKYARDLVAHALVWARDEIAEDMGGREALEALADDEYERLILDAYKTGPYLTQAMLTLWQPWTRTLIEIVATNSRLSDDDPETAKSFNILIRQARKSLGLPEQSEATPSTSALIPAFDADGYGRIKNDVISIGARRMLLASPARWNIDIEAWPAFAHENGSGKALYSPSRSHFPTARDAMSAVENYGPSHVAMLRFITAKYIANKESGTTGPYGGFYLSIDEFLDTVGRAKHAKGGYRPEDRREVVELIEALQHIDVTGSVEGYEKQSGKRGKKTSLTIRSPLIVVSQTIAQKGMPGSEERPVAWYLRPGDWAAELDRFGPQFAVATKALLQLNTQNDIHAFKLGCALEEEYRIRANQRSWKQPYRVRKLLENAEIEVDRKNPGRFRKRIEAALDVISNPNDMQGTPIIERWENASIVEAKGRGWLDKWLDSGIIITPPAGFLTPYESIGKRRRKPKKLAG